jgi:hypothetical protein
MPATNRVHYYHADACGFGGIFTRPIQQIMAPQAPMSLPPSGGYGTAVSENFQVKGLVSYKSASTQVSGQLDQKQGGGWITLATATVEDFNLLDIVTADRLVAQISTEHPLIGDNPTVTFLGTTIENLKISGHPVKVTLDLNICDQGSGNGYPKQACVSDGQFLSRVAQQYQQMNDAKSLPEWVKDRSIPDWVKARYGGDAKQIGKNGSVLCSIVKGTEGEFPGRPFCNVFEVPDFGRVFLGELMVDCKSYRLTMVRTELGSPTEGQNSAGVVEANGVTYPPTH